MSNFLKVLCAVGITVWSSAASANLVTNGGFDTGNFTGWTVSGNGISIDSIFAASPCCDAAFGAGSNDPNPGTLSQSLLTVPNHPYAIKFQLMDESGSFTNTFTVNFGNFSQSITGDSAAFAMTKFVLPVPGSDVTSLATDLIFQGINDTAAWNLDNVSVATSVPEPSSALILGVGLIGLLSMPRLLRRGS